MKMLALQHHAKHGHGQGNKLRDSKIGSVPVMRERSFPKRFWVYMKTGYYANGNQTAHTVAGNTYQLTYDVENRLVSVTGTNLSAQFTRIMAMDSA